MNVCASCGQYIGNAKYIYYKMLDEITDISFDTATGISHNIIKTDTNTNKTIANFKLDSDNIEMSILDNLKIYKVCCRMRIQTTKTI